MGAARTQRGFTLAKVMVALAGIGMLGAAAFVTRQMMTQATVTRIESDYRDISAAILAYQDRYHVLPGDDPAAATRFPGLWTAADNGDGDGVIQGDWNSTDKAAESRKIWKHLRGAGYLDGPSDRSEASYAPPVHAVGGAVGLGQGMYNLSGPVLVFAGLPGEINRRLEGRADDGSPAGGAIQANASERAYNVDASYDIAFRL
jgi:type II secretory pathway pseudopilin PulG